jgi:hypothetical protein
MTRLLKVWIVLLSMTLPFGIAAEANSTESKEGLLRGWIDQVIDENPGYIVIDSVTYRVPKSARISIMYEDYSLRLRNLVPTLKVEFRLQKAPKEGVETIRSIEVIPQ